MYAFLFSTFWNLLLENFAYDRFNIMVIILADFPTIYVVFECVVKIEFPTF